VPASCCDCSNSAAGWVLAQWREDESSGWPSLESERIQSGPNCSNRRSRAGDAIAGGSSRYPDLHLEINGRCTYRDETTINDLDQ